MTTLQTEYTEAELLASHAGTEPLIAGGVRCHGGFGDDGTYLPPRTLNRVPAIEAWREKHREDFGTDVIDVPLERPRSTHLDSVERSGEFVSITARLWDRLRGLQTDVRHSRSAHPVSTPPSS